VKTKKMAKPMMFSFILFPIAWSVRWETLYFYEKVEKEGK